MNSDSVTRKKADDRVRIRRVLNPLKVRQISFESAEADLKLLCEEKLLNAEMRAYIALLDMPGQKEITRELKRSMKDRKAIWRMFSKKEYLRLVLIVRTPHLYRFLYFVYEKYFQKKVYE